MSEIKPGTAVIASIKAGIISGDAIPGVLMVMDQYGEWQAPVEGNAYRQSEVEITSVAAVITPDQVEELIVYVAGEGAMGQPIERLRDWFTTQFEGGVQ